MVSFVRLTLARARPVLLLPLLALGGCIAPVAYSPNLCREMRATDMLQIHLMFGLTEPGGRPISSVEWNDFLAQDITPRFPAGLTVFDTAGQWLDTQTRTPTREPSKIVWISSPLRQNLQHDITAIRDAYKARFHQQSVGLNIESGCASF